MSKKVLAVVTNHYLYPKKGKRTGLWLSELTHFYQAMSEAGHAVDIISPHGGSVPLDPRSLKGNYLDAETKTYYQDQNFMDLLFDTRSAQEVNAADYAAIFYAGGHGTMWDFVDDKPLQELSRQIYEAGGIVSAVCHGPCGLINIKLSDGSYLVSGKEVTGFSNFEEVLAMVKSLIPYSLQQRLIENGANYKKTRIPFKPFLQSDARVVTGQNPNSTKLVAEEVLRLIAIHREA